MGKGLWSGRGQGIDTTQREAHEIKIYIIGVQLQYVSEALLSVQSKQKPKEIFYLNV